MPAPSSYRASITTGSENGCHSAMALSKARSAATRTELQSRPLPQRVTHCDLAQCPQQVRFHLDRYRNAIVCKWQRGADSVAKVFLSHRSQIFRAVGAAIEYWCGGPLHFVTNSLATSVARLRLHRSTVAACFVVERKFGHTAFWDFCNTINRRADALHAG